MAKISKFITYSSLALLLFFYFATSNAAPFHEASAYAHVAHAEGATGWAEGSASFAKVGAGAHAGWEGVGAGVDAKLFEVGGKLGKGPLSVGGKLGVSADTRVSFGQETTFKALGTGITFGGNNMIEWCFFGSCVSIG